MAPNPRLENIVQRLEKRVNKTQSTVSSSTTRESAELTTTTKTVPVGTVELASPKDQNTTVPTTSLVKKYVAKDAQEQRICAYIDKQLDSFPKKKDGSSIVQAQYTIKNAIANHYEVLFDIFVISTEKIKINLAPIQLNIIPNEEQLNLVAQLPKELSLDDAKKGVKLNFDGQYILAQWDEKLQAYKEVDATFNNISIQENNDDVTIFMGSLKASNTVKTTLEDNWTDSFSFTLEDITVKEKKGTAQLRIDSVNGKNEVQGKDFAFYLSKIDENFDFFNNVVIADKPQEVIDPKKLAVLDTFIELWSGTTGNFALKGLKFTEKDIHFTLDLIEAKSIAKKDPTNKEINSEVTALIQGIRVNEKNPKSQESIERLNFESLTFSNTGNLHKFPAQIFEKTGKLISDVIEAEDKKQYIPQGKEQLSAFLALFTSWGLNAELANLTVIPGGPNDKVHFDRLAIKHRIDATPKSGGLISLLYSLSGLKVDMETGFTLPEAAQISIEINKIPSLIDFIANTNNTPFEKFEADLPKLLLQSVMTSELTLKITDSFIAFPQSQLRINGMSTVDPNSPFFSSSSLQAAMINPENFLKNIEALNAMLPGISQAMGMYTALANRTTGEDGTTTDTLDIKTTQEGKILSNGKDVTSMLLGGQQETP